MKLYTDSEGNWRGTQAEARREFNKWSVVEVPTNKVDLLIFLNDFVPDWTAIPAGLFITIKLSLFSRI